MRPDGDVPVLAARLSRDGPLVLAALLVDQRPRVGEPVLLDLDGQTRIAQVVVSPDQLLTPPPEPPVARVIAAGADDPLVADALEARDLLALAEARALLADASAVRAARWSVDLGRLKLEVARNLPDVDAARGILARHYRADVRIVVA